MRLARVAAVAPALAIVLATCGGGASPSTAGDGSLARVKQAGELKVCAVDGLLPYSSSDTATPGFEVEIAQALATKLGVKAVHVWGNWDGLISMLTSKQCDVIVDGLFITDERKQSVDFAGEEYASGEAILVPKSDTTTKGLEDLTDKNVGVLSGSVTVDILQKAGFKDNLKIYPDQNTIILELNNGRIEAGFLEAPSAAWALKQDESLNIKLVEGYVPTERFDAGVAVRKEDKELNAEINKALADMRSDATIEGILNKYGVPFYPIK